MKAADTSAQVAANETVVDGSDAQTIMIIQDRESQEDYSKDGLLLQTDQVCCCADNKLK